MNRLKVFLPILEWLPQYRRSDLRGDILAGLTVGIMLVPQGMAYSMLAGLPPTYGLYASITPLILYAFFASSRQLSVGPVALISLLVFTGVSKVAVPGTPEFIGLTITVSILAGLMQLLFGMFRLGFLINFLSHPVLSGFTSAASLIILLSQFKYLLGLPVPGSNLIQEIMAGLVRYVPETNFPTLILGFVGVLIIIALKRVNRNLPTGLIITIPGILVVWFWGLDRQGVDIVGEVPGGFPHFSVPPLDYGTIRTLLSVSFTVFLVSFIESLAIAKNLETRHPEHRVSPNQELIALGVSKIISGFFQSFPTTGSFSRSVVNDQLGAKSGMSSIIAAMVVALTLLFLTPLLYFLPTALLGAVVFVSVTSLIDYKEAVRLWRTDRRDFLTLMVTFILTLTMGVQDGVLAGVLLSLGIMIYRSSRPHMAVLGRLPGSDVFRNIERFPDAELSPDILIIRFDAQLYFGNSASFVQLLENKVEAKGPGLRLVVLDCSNINDMDSTGVDALDEFLRLLNTKNVKLYLTNTIGPIRDVLYKHGLMERIGWQNHFLNIPSALEFYYSEKSHGMNTIPAVEALQTNLEEN